MDKLPAESELTGGDLFPLMMANALMWAVAIIGSLIICYDTGDYARLFPILGGGACVASVGCSITWSRRRKQRQAARQKLQLEK
jgi:hypothetical protein